LATVDRYKDLDVDPQALIWELMKNPLASPHRAADEIELRIRSRFKAMVEKERNRRELAPTDSLPDADDDTAPEIAAPPTGNLNLRLDMEARVGLLKPAEQEILIGAAVLGLSESELGDVLGKSKDAARAQRDRILEKARTIQKPPKKKR
jgi:DNA-directed RNA polymerase specialized sigma24 family protein